MPLERRLSVIVHSSRSLQVITFSTAPTQNARVDDQVATQLIKRMLLNANAFVGFVAFTDALTLNAILSRLTACHTSHRRKPIWIRIKENCCNYQLALPTIVWCIFAMRSNATWAGSVWSYECMRKCTANPCKMVNSITEVLFLVAILPTPTTTFMTSTFVTLANCVCGQVSIPVQ